MSLTCYLENNINNDIMMTSSQFEKEDRTQKEAQEAPKEITLYNCLDLFTEKEKLGVCVCVCVCVCGREIERERDRETERERAHSLQARMMSGTVRSVRRWYRLPNSLTCGSCLVCW